MIDFNHILNTPGVDVSYYTSINEWQTWRKLGRYTFAYILAVGAGGAGGAGIIGAGSGGGGGGGSGGQVCLLTPYTFLPDMIYIYTGLGGKNSTSAGSNTYIGIEANTGASSTMILARGGTGGSAGTLAAGGAGGAGGAAGTVAGIFLKGWSLASIVGQTGATGGTLSTIGGNITVPATGLMVTGGAGGGGANTSSGAGNGGIITYTTNPMGNELFLTMPVAVGGNSTANGQNGQCGFILKNGLMNYGGGGGGGDYLTTPHGGGIGGDAAPGCGGGGGGGGSSTNGAPRQGNGGDGFVYIISF